MEKAPGNKQPRSPEDLNTPIELHYSVATEISRVQFTARKYSWLVENGYQPQLPTSIKNHLESGDMVSDEEIRTVIEAEYQDHVYSEKARELTEAWKSESGGFIKKLETLGRPLPQTFKIFLSKYGTGGSYGYPDVVQLNLNRISDRGILYIVFHEMVHLTIQDLIEKYDISHWTKERLVDLTMNKFFPNKRQLQQDPEHTGRVSDIFEKGFPNIERIIKEISKI